MPAALRNPLPWLEPVYGGMVGGRSLGKAASGLISSVGGPVVFGMGGMKVFSIGAVTESGPERDRVDLQTALTRHRERDSVASLDCGREWEHRIDRQSMTGASDVHLASCNGYLRFDVSLLDDRGDLALGGRRVLTIRGDVLRARHDLHDAEHPRGGRGIQT